MKYCKFCGKEIENNQKCMCPDSVLNREKAKKNALKISIGGAVFLIAAIFIILVFTTVSDIVAINAFDYIEVTYTGYDTNGKAKIEFDIESIINNLIGEEPDIENQKEFNKWLVKQESYYDAIDCSYEPQNGLSNGDVVTVTITVSDILNGKVTGGSKTYTVSGLATIETVDVFSNIDVTFEGVSGEARANIMYKTDKDYLKKFSFDVEPRHGLSSGDTVTVTLKDIDDVAEEYNVIPKAEKKEFIVPDLESYVTSADQVTKSDIEDIIEQFVEQINHENVDDDIFSYKDVAYYNSYLLIPRNNDREKNTLIIYVKYDRYREGKYNETHYLSMKYTDVTVSSTGELTIEYDPGLKDGYVTDIESWLEKYENQYYVNIIE